MMLTICAFTLDCTLTGQNCISAERFLVHSRIYDRFVQGIASRLQQLQTGASCSGTRCDFGAITMPAQADIVEALVKDAIASGARVCVVCDMLMGI